MQWLAHNPISRLISIHITISFDYDNIPCSHSLSTHVYLVKSYRNMQNKVEQDEGIWNSWQLTILFLALISVHIIISFEYDNIPCSYWLIIHVCLVKSYRNKQQRRKIKCSVTKKNRSAFSQLGYVTIFTTFPYTRGIRV